MRSNPPRTDRRPSRARVRRTLPTALALAGLGPWAPVRLGPAPVVPGDLSWAVGLAGVLPLLLLYRRIRRSEVLDHDHRQRILDRVAEDAPATVGALARELDLDYKTVAHHVRVLEDFDLLEGRRRGQLRELYPAGGAPPTLPEPLRGEHETALALLRLVAEEPGITQAEAARRLEVARSTVSWHVDRLVEKDLLRPPRGAPGLEAGPALEEVRDVLHEGMRGRVAA